MVASPCPLVALRVIHASFALADHAHSRAVFSARLPLPPAAVTSAGVLVIDRLHFVSEGALTLVVADPPQPATTATMRSGQRCRGDRRGLPGDMFDCTFSQPRRLQTERRQPFGRETFSNRRTTGCRQRFGTLVRMLGRSRQQPAGADAMSKISLAFVVVLVVVTTVVAPSFIGRAQSTTRIEYARVTPSPVSLAPVAGNPRRLSFSYRACVAGTNEWLCREFDSRESPAEALRIVLVQLGNEGWELVSVV